MVYQRTSLEATTIIIIMVMRVSLFQTFRIILGLMLRP